MNEGWSLTMRLSRRISTRSIPIPTIMGAAFRTSAGISYVQGLEKDVPTSGLRGLMSQRMVWPPEPHEPSIVALQELRQADEAELLEIMLHIGPGERKD